MKGVFNPEVIAELRHRVIAHNEAVRGDPALTIKLGIAKGLYKRWFGGQNPHEHALGLLDLHLAQLLRKAEEFDPSKHPRGQRGEFASHQVRQIGFFNRANIHHHGGDGGDGGGGGRGNGAGAAVPGPLLTAAQTQVIPETRYSVLGPPIAGAAGVALGGFTGATATFRGSVVDRAVTRALEAGGGYAGKKLGGMAHTAFVRMPVHAARGAIGRANQALGTGFARPSIARGEAARPAFRQAGAQGLRRVARGVGLVAAAPSWPAAGMRALAAHVYPGRPIVGRAAGAVVGMLVPGLIYAHSLHHLQERLGPLEDALFPRRVTKRWLEETDALIAPWLTDERVLAKQMEVLESPLAKQGGTVGGIARRIIQAGAAAGAAGRQRIVGLLARRPSALHMLAGVGSTSPGAQAARAFPNTPTYRTARAVFERQRAHFTPTPSGLIGRIAGVARPVAAAAAGGAVLGGVGGRLTFNLRHPRDRRGRFTTKGQATISGARFGAAAGAALGLAAGLATVRISHGRMLAHNLMRLRGEEAIKPKAYVKAPGPKPFAPSETGPDVNLPETMGNEVEAETRNIHASIYKEEHKRKGKDQIPKNVPATEEGITNHLGNKAVEEWRQTGGQAMAAGAQPWYHFQLDEEFDNAVRRDMPKPIPFKGGVKATSNLYNNVDAAAFNPAPIEKRITGLEKQLKAEKDPAAKKGIQTQIDGEKKALEKAKAQNKVWTDLKGGYDRTRKEIDKTFIERKRQSAKFEQSVKDMEARKTQLEQRQKNVPSEWDDTKSNIVGEEGEEKLSEEEAVKAIRGFVRDNLSRSEKGRTLIPKLKGKTVEELIPEVDKLVGTFPGEAEEELRQIAGKLPDERGYAKTAKQAEGTDLEPEAVANPFRKKKTDKQFLEPRLTPLGMADHEEQLRKDVVKGYLASAQDAVDEARGHLKNMFDEQEALIKAGGMQRDSAFHRGAQRLAAKIAPAVTQGRKDLNDIYASAREAQEEARKKLPPGSFRQVMSDIVHANENPTQAWATIKALKNKAQDYGKEKWKQINEHWRAIAWVAGLLSTVGVLDWAEGGLVPKVKRRRLRNVEVVMEPVDAIKKPGEILFGVSHKSYVNNRQQFLFGTHIKGTERHTIIPVGADVENTKASARERGGGGPGGGAGGARQPLEINDVARKELNEIRSRNQISNVGPAGFQFRQRTGGGTGGQAEVQASGALRGRHLNPQGTGGLPLDQTVAGKEPFYAALRDFFEQPNGEAMGSNFRATLLTGRRDQNNKLHRGLLPNANEVLLGKDNDAITKHLKSIINTQGRALWPENPNEYGQWRRAIWLVSTNKGLSDNQQQEAVNALNHAYTSKTGRPPPTSITEQAPGTSGSATEPPWQETFEDHYNQHLRRVYENNAEVNSHYPSERDFRVDMEGMYNASVNNYKMNHPDATPAEQHHAGALGVDQHLFNIWGLRRSVENEGLRKFLIKQPPPAGLDYQQYQMNTGQAPGGSMPGYRPRAVRPIHAGAMPQAGAGTGGITDGQSSAGMRAQAPKQPSMGGLGYQLSTAGQAVGSVGLGRVGAMLPGTWGKVGEAVGNIAGAFGGQAAGHGAAHAMGGAPDPGGTLTGALTGGAASLAINPGSRKMIIGIPKTRVAQAITKPIAGAARSLMQTGAGQAVRQAAGTAGQAISGAAGRAMETGAGQAIKTGLTTAGEKIGGSVLGTVARAALPSLAEAGAATLAGGPVGLIADVAGNVALTEIGDWVANRLFSSNKNPTEAPPSHVTATLSRNLDRYGPQATQLATRSLGYRSPAPGAAT